MRNSMRKFPGRRWFRCVGLAAPLLLCACGMDRLTTTQRTVIEQALLSQSAEQAVARLEIPAGEDRRFFIDAEEFEATGKPHILAALHHRLLLEGYRVAGDRDDADVIVHPRALYAGIDDDRTFVGIPAIPIPVPGVGTMATPEVVIFRLLKQRGRASIAQAAYERESGAREFDQAPVFGEKRYDRWTILIFFHFRTSDLGEPF
jgi:hypothetical protein